MVASPIAGGAGRFAQGAWFTTDPSLGPGGPMPAGTRRRVCRDTCLLEPQLRTGSHGPGCCIKARNELVRSRDRKLQRQLAVRASFGSRQPRQTISGLYPLLACVPFQPRTAARTRATMPVHPGAASMAPEPAPSAASTRAGTRLGRWSPAGMEARRKGRSFPAGAVHPESPPWIPGGPRVPRYPWHVSPLTAPALR
jgi:hypothetical protein